ncbi:hypothetical protein FPQ18DRAFT_404993 [Pyronema domesticum]|nr:hypothetical protein FPQ18DRAFT_404993 [Pyronema domesticum]
MKTSDDADGVYSDLAVVSHLLEYRKTTRITLFYFLEVVPPFWLLRKPSSPVRAATYIQSLSLALLLGFLSSFLSSARLTLTITSLALVLSALILSFTSSLSLHHAFIISNLLNIVLLPNPGLLVPPAYKSLISFASLVLRGAYVWGIYLESGKWWDKAGGWYLDDTVLSTVIVEAAGGGGVWERVKLAMRMVRGQRAVMALVFLVVLVWSTESFITWNLDGGTRIWGYGQITAVVLSGPPVMELVRMILRAAGKGDREKEKEAPEEGDDVEEDQYELVAEVDKGGGFMGNDSEVQVHEQMETLLPQSMVDTTRRISTQYNIHRDQ